MCAECKRQHELDSAGGLDLYKFVSSLDNTEHSIFLNLFQTFVCYLKENNSAKHEDHFFFSWISSAASTVNFTNTKC